jgi:peptide/nickel transport system ATP-binding protein
MFDVAGDDRHDTRCLRFDEIDWNAPPRRSPRPRVTPGDVVLRLEDLKKYYEVSANKLFGGGEMKVVKANETLSFEAREAETIAIVGESGCGKSTFAKVLMGLETATDGKIVLYNQDIHDTPIEKRATDTVSSSRWCSRTPSTR